ncbi:amino acid adenylation domain-containing protein [Kosakonia cowanii]|uniref:amino acid adenylation domain-containing protein n=1 Tax=Kosakonia cowanii TaxID=208223 RepID=UPI0023F969DB|nr:non-ribosomal peptide synthetase [Kosakonia cowanii]MDF7759294.1 amino acid adenylation domain-containing protein [Kosakonia cowanii]
MNMDIKEILPLSPLQKGLLFHMLLDTRGSDAYQVQQVYQLEGELNVARLKQAVGLLLARHPHLCAGFEYEEVDTPVQLILSGLPLPWQEVDLSTMSLEQQTSAFHTLLERDYNNRFAPGTPPLLRFTLVKCAPTQHKLIFTNHHLLLDGWSIPVLLEELFRLYLADTPEGELPPAVPYRDYLQWLARRDTGKMREAWREALRGLQAPTCLAGGRTTDNLQPHLLYRTVDAGRTRQLNRCARELGVTVNTLLQCAWGMLLGALTGRCDVVFGITVSGRPAELSGIERMVGLLINTLPLRLTWRMDERFATLLQRLQAEQTRLLDSQYLDLTTIQADAGGEPLFDTLMVFENYPHSASAAASEKLTVSLDSHRGGDASHYPLGLIAVPGETLSLRFSALADIFADEEVERLADRFLHLLYTLIDRPDSLIGHASLLLPQEAQALLPVPISFADSVQTTLHEVFEQRAAQYPDATALSLGDNSLRYDELNQRANQLARHLVSCGIGSEECVALALPRTLEALVATLAVLKAGAAYLPLDVHNPPERLAYILSDARPALIVSLQEYAGMFAESPLLLLDSAESQQQLAQLSGADLQQTERLRPVQAHNLAYIIYTSGSTGNPKGVMIPHSNVLRLFAATEAWFSFSCHDIWTLFHSCSFDFSVWEIWGALLYGGELVVVPFMVSRDPQAFLRLLSDKKVTILNQTPSAFYQLIEAERNLPHDALPLALRKVIFGGEALDLSQLSRWYQRHPDTAPELINMYGITETTVHVSYQPLTAARAREATGSLIGMAIPDQHIHLLDDALRPVPPGVEGEMYISGAGLARGYLNRVALSSQRFVADPWGAPGSRMYRSGDIAVRSKEGELHYLGRADQQVKLRGFRIELGEIAAVLRSAPQVSHAEVVLLDADTQPQLVAYVTGDTPAPLDMDALRNVAAAKLPGYMVPTAIIQLAQFPLTLNGKLDKRALPRPDLTARSERRAPRTLQEEILQGLFAEVLQSDLPGIDDDFFALGGHSLLAMRLVSLITRALEVEVPIRTLFDYPTVAQLAGQLAKQGSRPGEALRPQPRSARLPLSLAQQRMWLLKNLDNNHAAYNMPLAIRLQGALNDAALREAVRDVVARHEILRTRYPLHQGQPWQEILAPDALEVTFEVNDIAASSLADALNRAAACPFELADEIPLRATLFHLSQTQEHVLLLVIHHIACDGGSLAPLFRDLACAYTARCAMKIPEWTPLPVQYADYALWQRERLGEIENHSEIAARQLAFWREALSGVPEAMALPVDRHPTAETNYLGEQVRLRIDERLYQQITQLARHEGATPFMVLQTAAAILFSRMGAGEDITLGTAVAGRSDEAMRDLVGFFVNTLVLRVDLAANPTVGEALAQVREFMLSAWVNQEVPFDWVVKSLNPERVSGRHPLFQVMMVLQNNDATPPQFAELSLLPQPVGLVTTKFDLTFNVEQVHDPRGDVSALEVQIDYPVDRFDAQTITALADSFTHLLQAMVDAPDSAVMTLPLLSDRQRKQMLDVWNETHCDVPPATLAAHFSRQVAATPQRIAVSCAQEQLSYQQLDSCANALARRLQHQGVNMEQGVAVLMTRSLSLVIALLAVVKAGGFYVPLRASDPTERWQHIIDELDVRCVLVDENHSQAALPAGVQRLIVDDAATQAAAPAVSTPVTPHHLAYVMFTSGSTGKPKGIATTQDNVLALARDRRWQAEACQRILLHSAYAFDASTWELWGTLLNGHHAVIVPGETLDLPLLTATLVEGKVTTAFLTSGLFRLIAEEASDALAGLRRVYTGGEKISASAVQAVRERWPHLELLNIYGPTEITTYATDYLITQADAPYVDVPIGRAFDNTRLYVLDSHLQPVPPGVAAELYIAGRGVARGYVNHPALSAAHFVADPFGPAGSRMYRTGDIVKWRRDGALCFDSRRDQQVKIRGFRIEPGEVEMVLKQHAAVQQAAVVALEDRHGNKQLVAYVVPSVQEADLSASLQQFARDRLPDFMVPAAIVLLAALPLNANGKLALADLPKPDFHIEPGRAPQNERELWLARQFCELLNVEAITVDSSFFALGGHSLLAARLINAIDTTWKVKLTLRDLFEHPTVALLAQRLQSNQRSNVLDVLLPLQPRGEKTPLFCLPPGGGLSWSYAGLIPWLGDAQPLFGLQAQRLSSGKSLPSVNALAKRYLAEIVKVQPNGPYALLGWSFGCHLAHEIATLLQQAGQVVSALILLDGYPLGERYREKERQDSESLAALFEALTGSVPDESALTVEALRRCLVAQEHPLAVMEPVVFEHILAEFREAPRLLAAFTPSRFQGDILFLRAATRRVGEERLDAQLWSPFVEGRVVTHTLPCSHDGMFSPQALQQAGPLIRDWIAGRE